MVSSPARREGACERLLDVLNFGLPPSRTCPTVQPWLYGYDAKRETEAALKNSTLLQTS